MGLHGGQPGGVEEAGRHRCGGGVERDYVRFAQQAVCIDKGHAQAGCIAGRQAGVGGEEAKAEALHPRQHGPADLAQAEKAEDGLREGLHRLGDLHRRPVAAPDRGIKLRQFAQQAECCRRRVIGHLIGAIVGHIAHAQTGGLGRGQVDVVVADAVADDGSAGVHGAGGFGGEGRELHHGHISAPDGFGHLCRRLALEGGEIRPRRRSLFLSKVGEGVIGDDDAQGHGVSLR